MRTNSFGRNSGRGLGQWMDLSAAPNWFAGTRLPDSVALDIVSDDAGNLYVVALGAANGTFKYKQYVLRFNADGTLEWQRELSVAILGTSRPTRIGVNGSGSVVVVLSNDDSASDTRAVLSKYDGDSGALGWQRHISLSGVSIAGYDLAVGPSGDSVVVGDQGPYGTWGIAGFVAKFNSSGTMVWSDSITQPSGGPYTYSLSFRACSLDSSGNVFAQSSSDLFKYNSSGTMLWDRSFFFRPSAMAVAPSGAIYFIVSSALDLGYRVLKFSNDGDPVWSQKTNLTIPPSDVCVNGDEHVFAVSGYNYGDYIMAFDSAGSHLFDQALGSNVLKAGPPTRISVSGEGHLGLLNTYNGMLACHVPDTSTAVGSPIGGSDAYRTISYGRTFFYPSSSALPSESTPLTLTSGLSVNVSTAAYTGSTPTDAATTVYF